MDRAIIGLRMQAELNEFEAAITAQRADEPLPAGKLAIGISLSA